MAVSENEKVKKAISYYYTKLRNIKISVGGKELQETGIKPGPHYREILKKVHNARLNSEIKTREDELNLVKKYSAEFL